MQYLLYVKINQQSPYIPIPKETNSEASDTSIEIRYEKFT